MDMDMRKNMMWWIRIATFSKWINFSNFPKYVAHNHISMKYNKMIINTSRVLYQGQGKIQSIKDAGPECLFCFSCSSHFQLSVLWTLFILFSSIPIQFFILIVWQINHPRGLCVLKSEQGQLQRNYDRIVSSP